MNANPDLCTTSAVNHLAAPHLTDDQIDDHLIGDLAAAPAAHLAACALCADRVATALSPLDSFHAVSTAWSERRSATLPIPAPTQQRPFWQRNAAVATAALMLAFSFAVTNASHQLSLQPTAPPSYATQSAALPATAAIAAALPIAQPVALRTLTARPAFTETASIAPSRAAHIAADNRLLRSINAAFDPSSDSPAALGLVSETAPSTRPPTSIQD